MSANTHRASSIRAPGDARLLRGWARWLVMVLQLVVLLLPVQASGVFHAVTDVVVALTGEKVHHGNPPCSHEEQGQHCPPGCPDCHCALAAPALLPTMQGLVLTRVVELPLVVFLQDTTAPPRPLLSGIDRPPRAARFA